ncbi:MAG: hypothetical protein Aurels2KO_10640 [Aureliella sp.]
MTKDEAIEAARLLKEQERAVEGRGLGMYVGPYYDENVSGWRVLVGYSKHAGVVCDTPFAVIFGWHTVERCCRAIAEGMRLGELASEEAKAA